MQSTSIHASTRALLSPTRFFRESRPQAADAGPIVLAVAVIHLVSYYLILLGGAVLVSLQQPAAGVGDLLADLGPGTYALGLLVGVLVVVTWLLVSAVLHVGIKVQDGNGSFADTLGVVGWSAPASLLGIIVQAAGFWLALWGNSVAMSFDAKLIAIGPSIGLAGLVGGVLVLLWQGAIWPPGLAHAHDVSGGAAGKASGLTVLVGTAALLLGL